MRIAFSLSLIAIGVSFLLPSDAYKAALFVSFGILLFLLMRDPEPTVSDAHEATDAGPEYDEDGRYEIT